MSEILEKTLARQTANMGNEATPADGEAAADVLADRLVEIFRGMGSAAVALSGGVDSSVVAKAAQVSLGERAVAVTGRSPSLAASELEHARAAATAAGIRHVIVDTDEFANDAYVRNDGTRCYHCKSELYDVVLTFCRREGIAVVCSGANVDDLGDYRPGLTSAAERGVRHPLQEAGIRKAQVRTLAAYWGLPNWDKPASPCLSSRIAVGLEATPERVARIEQAEAFLRSLGLCEFRVRCHHGELARVETAPEDVNKTTSEPLRSRIVDEFRRLGFSYVSVDLEGFRSGSLNAMVPIEMLSKR